MLRFIKELFSKYKKLKKKKARAKARKMKREYDLFMERATDRELKRNYEFTYHYAFANNDIVFIDETEPKEVELSVIENKNFVKSDKNRKKPKLKIVK